MSYCRFGEADVYVYMDVNGTLACCGCPLGDYPWYYASTDAMIEHLAAHRAAGHNVPEWIEDELRADDEENFPPQCREGHDPGPPYHPFPDDPYASIITRRKCQRCGWEPCP